MCNVQQRAASPQLVSSTVTSTPATSGEACFVFGEHLAERVVMPAGQTVVADTAKILNKEKSKVESEFFGSFTYSY